MFSRRSYLIIFILTFAFIVLVTYLANHRLTFRSRAGIDCGPYGTWTGSFCDYRHTTDENDPNAPVLNPNYLDTYQDCWDKCMKVDVTEYNACHYGNSLVSVRRDLWSDTSPLGCSFVCNWACGTGEPIKIANPNRPSPTDIPQPTIPPTTSIPLYTPTPAPLYHEIRRENGPPTPTNAPQTETYPSQYLQLDRDAPARQPESENSGGPSPSLIDRSYQHLRYWSRMTAKKIEFALRNTWYSLSRIGR